MDAVSPIEFKQSGFAWNRARLARIFALPIVVVGITGWIPNSVLDIGPKGPWPWGALLAVSLILTSLLGLVRPCCEALASQAVRAQQSE
jgi:hypothetical protein